MYSTEAMITFLCQRPSLRAINKDGYVIQVDSKGNIIWARDYELNINDEWEVF